MQTSHALIVIIVFTPWSIQQPCCLGWFVCCWRFQTQPAVIASSNSFPLQTRHYVWEHRVALNFSAWFQFLMPTQSTLRAEMYQKWQIFPPLSCQSWKTRSMLRYNQQPWAVIDWKYMFAYLDIYGELGQERGNGLYISIRWVCWAGLVLPFWLLCILLGADNCCKSITSHIHSKEGLSV